MTMFLQWLNDRTGIPALCGLVRRWTVPSCRCVCRFLPTMILFAFILQAITGVFLWAHYSPSAQSAWESLFYLQFVLPGGWMLRGIHHYSGQVLTALLGLYLLTLIYRGSYRAPREFVFWTAFLLFLFSLASSLTGDLLTWTLSGVSATLVRVRFLQMIPFVGESLFKIVAGGSEFGTLTIPRFLVLHVLVFGGGFFVLAILWRFFDHRADARIGSTKAEKESETAKDGVCPVRVPFWSGEVLKGALACLLTMFIVLALVYQKPVLAYFGKAKVNENFRNASLGAGLGSPADPGSSYDAARPEWSFRALYHFCNIKNGKGEEIFEGSKKFIPVFVVTSGLMFYAFLIPVIGRLKIGHYFNLLAVTFLFLSVAYLTYASYHHDFLDPAMESFREDYAKEKRMAERSIELCFSPEGIPSTGALTLLGRDPYLAGPALYERHCAVCHPFQPMEGDELHPDFAPIPCETIKAPNLYNPIRKKWIAGFLNRARIESDDYFGKTKFAKGSMRDFVRGELDEILEDDEYKDMFEELQDLLEAEAKRDAPRPQAGGETEGLTTEQVNLFSEFNCTQCHWTYADAKPVIQAPDLRGYMSRDWMIGIVANPESVRFYGPSAGTNKGNDAMPLFHPNKEDATMTLEEIETVVDWLRGHWFRYQKPGAEPAETPSVAEPEAAQEATIPDADLKPLDQ